MFWIDPLLYTLRVIDGKREDLPPYRALGVVVALGDVIVIEGLHGKIKAREVFEFYEYLRNKGFRYLLARRIGSHKLPGGRRIEREGAFNGWYEVDLETA
jgi:hypothetical protein